MANKKRAARASQPAPGVSSERPTITIHPPVPGDAAALYDRLLDLAADILARQAQEQGRPPVIVYPPDSSVNPEASEQGFISAMAHIVARIATEKQRGEQEDQQPE